MRERQSPAPVVLGPGEGVSNEIAPAVTVTELLDDSRGCHGLHQRRLTVAAGTVLAGTVLAGIAAGLGESWYVLRGRGHLAPVSGLQPENAVWIPRGTAYRVRADEPMEILATTVCAGAPGTEGDPAVRIVPLADCAVERTGDREFRILLSSGLTFTQFVGEIPPGRAPAHHHTGGMCRARRENSGMKMCASGPIDTA